MPSFTRSKVIRTRETINAAKRALQLHYFNLWGKSLAFMAPYGTQSKAQKKSYARYLAKFIRRTKSLPLEEWGTVHYAITKKVRLKWPVRSNNDLDPAPLVRLRDMEIPPMLGRFW